MAFESSSTATIISDEVYSTDHLHEIDFDHTISAIASASEQERELEALRKQSSRLTHLLEVMPAGVIVLDGKGIVRQANDQARSLLGEPLEGQIWRTIISRSFRPRADDGHEVSLFDGRRVKLSITPLVNEPGQLIVLTDLTETRQLQARISHLQRLSSLGKMVASLAHQIRTPLSAAMLYASNLTRKGLGEEASQQFSRKLSDRLKELENQVNDMLLFAKSGEQQVVNSISVNELHQAIEATANTIVQQSDQTVVFTGTTINATIMGNLTALQGALTNLIQNASHVSPKQSQITVDFRVHNRLLSVSVSDAGPGVAPEIQDKITEPFFTTKTHGTGLGLAVVKSVVSAHHGKLTIVNNPNGGATFTLCFPRSFSTDLIVSEE